jgi:pyruvate/2-oxoacid:ferredoxin oxidoreductase alpha subunit
MASINYTNYNIDQTVRVFDTFYEYDVNIPASEYDVVNSYFKSVMTTKQAADNFTASLFRVAEDTNIPALTLLETFQASGAELDLNINMAYYLNSIRSRATLLGVGVPVTPNYYAARNVVQ